MSEPTIGRQLALFPAPAARAGAATPLASRQPLEPQSSLAVALGAFDEQLAAEGKTIHTRRAFASDLRLLARCLGAERALSAIGTEDLNRYLTWLLQSRSQPCRPKTYARRVTTLKVFFAWLAASGVLTSDPAAALVHRPAEAPLPLVLTDAQVRRLLQAAEHCAEQGDPRPALMVRLLLDTALKKGELSRLRPADLATAAEPPSLLVRYDEPRRRQKERRVSFSPWVAPLLERHLRRTPAGQTLFDCTDRNLEYLLADPVAAAGLPERTSFETLRWTSALRARRAGLAPERLRERLGLSPVTWVKTEPKLALLAPGVGPSGADLGLFFPPP